MVALWLLLPRPGSMRGWMGGPVSFLVDQPGVASSLFLSTAYHTLAIAGYHQTLGRDDHHLQIGKGDPEWKR